MSDTKRSDEPIWWGLFSAGGVCFAVLLPGLMLLVGILWPLGLVKPDWLHYASLSELVRTAYSVPALFAGGAIICLPLFHAAHRIHHGLHDLKCACGQTGKLLCYGLAFVFSLLALLMLLAV